MTKKKERKSMKKFSLRKIASLVLVFCMFVSVIANVGVLNVRAEGTNSLTVEYKGSGTGAYVGASGGYDLDDQWINIDGYWLGVGGSNDWLTVAGSGNSFTATWDTSVASGIWFKFGCELNGTWVVYEAKSTGGTVVLYDNADGTGVTTEAPDETPEETPDEGGETVTHTFNFESEGDSFMLIGNGYSDANGWVADCNTWQTASDDVITFGGSGNSLTLTWNTEDAVELYVIIAGNTKAGSWNQDLKITATGGTTTIYDTADGAGFTTEAPAEDGGEETTVATATVTYAGTGTGYWFGSTSCANADKTAWPSYDWISSGSNDYITITADGASWTVTWDPAAVAEVYVEFGVGSNKEWPTLTDGTAITYYDTEDGGLTTEAPAPALKNSSTITYAGEQSVYAQTWGYWDNTLSTWVVLDGKLTNGSTFTDPAGKLYMSMSGNVLTVNWAGDVGPSAGIQVEGMEGDAYLFFPDHYNGGAWTVYDAADGTLSQEAPSTASFTASATITYYGNQSVWTGSSGGCLNDGNWTWQGWDWINGPAVNDFVAITHVGNVYTIKWDPDVLAAPSFGFGVSGDYTDEIWPDIYDGAAYTYYDGDSKLSAELPAQYASATIVYMGAHDDTWTTAYGLTPARTDINGWWINDSASPSAPVGQHIICSANGNAYTYSWDANIGATCWVLFGCNSYAGDAPYFGLKNGQVIYIYDKDILGRLECTAPYMVTSTVVVDSEQDTWSGITALCTTDGDWISDLWIDNDANDYGITVTKTVADGKTVYTYTYDFTQIRTVCAKVGTTSNAGTDSNLWINLSGFATRNLYINEDNGGITTFPNGYTYVKPGSGEGIDGSVTIHYVREDANYTGWYFGYWYQVDGEWMSYNKTFSADGTYVLPLNDIPAAEIGFVVNYNDWASKDIEFDRFIQINKLVADENGNYNVWLYSGDENVYYEPKA